MESLFTTKHVNRIADRAMRACDSAGRLRAPGVDNSTAATPM